MSGKRSWEIDWAGPHGTAWGTVNACLSVVTAAWTAHLAERWLQVSTFIAAWCAVAGTALGVVIVLIRAAFTRRRRHPVTVMYQVCCCLGAGIWVSDLLRYPHWPLRWWLIRLAGLVVMALIAGVLAGLASDNPPEPAEDKANTEADATARRSQKQRNVLGEEWVERIRRVLGVETLVENIEPWPAGNGYTVEGVVQDSGKSWRTVADRTDDLEADMDLKWGCRITGSMGNSRRRFLLDVMTANKLAEDHDYPANRPVHSMRNPLEFGVTDSGQVVGPNLRQNCMVLGGESGSGKSNAGHCITAEIVTTDDGLEWDWDLTGKKWSAWLAPWLRGEVEHPPIDWCAGDGQELLFMTRAALRVGLARSVGYQQLMLDADDDKLPIGPDLPEVVLVGDEIARVTGAMSEHMDAQENLRLVTFEHRGPAVRAVFLALRGTDDVILSSIQSQCQVKGVMRVTAKSEVNWIVGNSSGFGPEDTPYPGCGGLSLESGRELIKVKWRRMKPSTIARIVRLVDERAKRGQRPVLDELSRLAANGRHPDGTPMPDLLPGELDCYDTRWARFRGAPAAPSAASAAASPPAAPVVTGTPGSATQVPTMDQAVKDLNAAMADLDARVEAVKARAAAQEDDIELPPDERAEFDRILAAEGFGPEFGEDEAEAEPETPPRPDDEQMLLDLIRAAGPGGMKPKQILAELKARYQIVIHRDTLHERLRGLKAAGQVFQPSYGRWAVRDAG